MFVVKSDFIYPPYNIPGLDRNNSFLTFVGDEEAKVLKLILGLRLYNEFIAGLEEDYPEDKWLNLRDGAEYEIGDDLYEWKGLTTRNGAIVPYIFSQWLRAGYDSYTENGVVIASNENSEVIDPSLRVSRAYNSFADMIGHKKLLCKEKNTLYGFLTCEANVADYESLKFGDVGTVNIFDL